jgi:hypothetical protein
MPDRNETGRQPGWRILVAASAITLTGGVAAVNAASETPTRVTLDDVVPMTEVAEPSPIVLRDGATDAAPAGRHDSPFELVLRQAERVDVADRATQGDVDSVDPTPNTPDPTPNSPDPTPNTPDPTPNSPDPTPNTPDNTPDPTPNSPDPVSPDPSPNSPDASPESPD